jgi:hypothetical protein
MSNIGIPGKFIFRVDLAAIQRPTGNAQQHYIHGN